MSLSEYKMTFLELFPTYREITELSPPIPLTLERREKGSYLCSAGDPLPRLLFLVEGRARVFLPLFAGRSFLLRIFQPGDVVGDLEFFLDVAATCSVQCTSAVTLYSCSMDNLRAHASNGPVVLALGASVAQKLKQNSVSEAVNAGYSVASRLAAYFLTHRDPDLQARNLQELSEWLGTSYRHLTRTLHMFVSKGALRKLERRYSVADETALRLLAEDVLNEEPRRM